MTSKFRYTAYLSLIFLVFVVTISLLHLALFKEVFTLFYGGKFVYIILAISIFSALNRIKAKAIKITIDDNAITVRNFLGFGKKTVTLLYDINGFYTSQIRSRYSRFEYIYIMKDTKKIAKISNQYHTNYTEMEAFIRGRLLYLGAINTNVITEFIDLAN